MEREIKKLEGEWKSDNHERRKALADFKDSMDSDWGNERKKEYITRRMPIVKKDKRDLEYLIAKNEINGRGWLNEVLKEKLKRVDRKFKRWSADLAIINGAKNSKKISEEVIQQCRNVPLEDIIEGEKQIQGNNRIKMKCPFHDEKTSSFVIYQETNSAHCFGCKKTIKGAVSYIMETKDMQFLQAVNYLMRYI